MPITITLHNVPLFLFFCGASFVSYLLTIVLPKHIKRAIRKWRG